MSERNDPEQRSATSQPQSEQTPARPTGDEVYSGQTKGPLDKDPPEAETTAEEIELTQLEELQRAAADAYARLGEVAERLTDRAVEAYDTGRDFARDNPSSTVLGAFALGVLLGFLTNDR